MAHTGNSPPLSHTISIVHQKIHPTSLFNDPAIYYLLPLRGGKMSDLIQKIGDRVRQLRLQKGLTQEGFASSIPISPNYLGNIERGEKYMSLDMLIKIKSELGVSLEEFFSVVDPNYNDKSEPLIKINQMLLGRSEKELHMILNIIESLLVFNDER